MYKKYNEVTYQHRDDAWPHGTHLV